MSEMNDRHGRYQDESAQTDYEDENGCLLTEDAMHVTMDHDEALDENTCTKCGYIFDPLEVPHCGICDDCFGAFLSSIGTLTHVKYEVKVHQLAKFALGEIVFFKSGCSHIAEGAEATIVAVGLDHTHGGSRIKPWWTRHEDACFDRKNVEYTLAIGFQPNDKTAKLRWKAKQDQLSSAVSKLHR